MAREQDDIPLVKALLFMKYHSNRVPGKNLRPIGGKPLFFWILHALSQSRYIGEIILNTDSEIIAEEVNSCFDITIHMRPEHLLTITSNEANQIIEYDISVASGEHFLQTHSTNPLLTSATVDESIVQFFERALPKGHDSLFSVTPHRKRFFFLDGTPVNHDPQNLRKTQELKPLYEENSCIYLFSRTSFEASGMNRIGQNPYMFEMRAEEAVDIDTEDDFLLAQRMMRSSRAE